MQVYISKNDQQWGPFDLNQLERLKGEGALKATDWAWEQGESGWVPLAAVLERHGNGCRFGGRRRRSGALGNFTHR